MPVKRTWQLLTLAIVVMLLAAPIAIARASGQAAAEAGTPEVYVVPVESTIESGLQHFLERAFKQADKQGAKAIVLRIDTLGGSVDAATRIGELVRNSAVPTIAFVEGKAASAGSYIALNAGAIVMKPGSSIGAAAVVDGSGKEIESSKIIAYWAGEMRSAAELHGRNTDIAQGMVDKNKEVQLPSINRTFGKGEIVSLSADEALKVGYADAVADTIQAGIHALKPEWEKFALSDIQPTFAEKLARFLIHPVVMTLLLLVGIAGVAIELFVPGFGLPGILGIAGFALYFFGHYVAGFAGSEDIVLFVIGIVLLVVEMFLPTFGLVGIAGIVCVVAGVVLAAANAQHAFVSLGIAFVIAAVIVAVAVKYFGHRGIWNRFILKDEQKNESGYTSSASKDHLLGMTGTAATPLRPAGTAQFGEERADVVTEGEFIPAGRPVRVVKVEGGRVVVREQTE